MNILNKLVINENNKALVAFGEIYPDYRSISYNEPTDYISKFWPKFLEKNGTDNGNLNGNVFEILLGSLLIREKIVPFYVQVKLAFVSNVLYDIVMFDEENNPLIISAKTSLRERYKQADLEAWAAKNVYRKACCYLITLNSDESERINKKASDGELYAIDECIYAMSPRFNDFILGLGKRRYKEPGKIDIVSTPHHVVGGGLFS